ncbi:molecular chaperone, HSP90 family [Rubidibacter lacunae KORDI 51-2]|uniref:Molecular chaperone, HSP90 family n=1 Tax=Rubidibacter lacunae KORDI 51-2 TaxID=582515 RepID=U5DI99_9CHRO|nr:molecular chaperone HtpG [Rubidibacter lacunae]ERN41396.1 molecular chaperone, HSP90 family [Rubidibacter lacunae KORDI 51-2]
MTVLKQGSISIHTENIFPIIKKSLYTNHEIFLRELISNSVDAIAKLKMATFAGEVAGELDEPRIKIFIDKSKKQLSVTDNGIGMTAEEIEKYINQVAFSSAEEFVQKYQGSEEQLIGQFGLGFYSSFMVASKVEIDTLSARPDSQAVHWLCDGSPAFELAESERAQRGTTVTLTLLDDELEYLEPQRIRHLIKTYCDFMPVAIELDNETINKQRAIWKESPQNLTDEDYLEFYRYLYPAQEDPLLWVHLNTDYPFLLNGILYFPKLRPDVDVTRGQISLYCNQVFVSDRCEEVVPEFLLPLRGVIDSTDIPLNVSRSALTANRTVRRIADYIAKKIGDRLKSLYREDRAQYIRSWQDVGTFVKYGTMRDEKFKKQVEDSIVYRTTAKLAGDVPKVEVQSAEGDVWESTDAEAVTDDRGYSYTTLQAYLDRNKDKHENRVFYCTDPSTQATYLKLYEQQGLEALFLDSFMDANYFIPFLEHEHSNLQFVRVDAELDGSLVEQDQAGELVDPATNKSRNQAIKELFEAAIADPKVNVKVQALKSDDPQGTPPAMVLLPEAMRRLKEMTALMQQKALEFPDDRVLVVNSLHPLVQNVVKLAQSSIVSASGESPSAETARLMCCYIYDLALMAQQALDSEGIEAFVARSNQVLTRLTQ